MDEVESEQLREAAEMARDAAIAVSPFRESDPDFAGDEDAWRSYQDALTSLASAYYQTTHSGMGLVSGQLLSVALPAMAMRFWENAVELASAGAAYAELEASQRDKGGKMYDYANMPDALGALGLVEWSAPDIASADLADLSSHAWKISGQAYKHWSATVDAPVEELPDASDQEAMLQNLSMASWGLDVAGNFAFANSPALDVLLTATIVQLARRSWSTVYPFAAATALLADYQRFHLEPH